MPDKHEEAERMRPDVPSTVARSDDKAVRTYKKTLESAEETYGKGERAHRAAFASLKHTHEKVGDHWEPKEQAGPSDVQAARGAPQAVTDRYPTAQGVDANASKGHLDDVARRVGIEHPEDMNKGELVDAIRRANARATAQARKKDK
ncbi:MAG TPA: ChaB family protein [Micromonosporaceae bacterium]